MLVRHDDTLDTNLILSIIIMFMMVARAYVSLIYHCVPELLQHFPPRLSLRQASIWQLLVSVFKTIDLILIRLIIAMVNIHIISKSKKTYSLRLCFWIILRFQFLVD